MIGQFIQLKVLKGGGFGCIVECAISDSWSCGETGANSTPAVEVANESQKTLDFVTNTLKLKDPVAADSIKSASVTIDGVAVEGSQFDYKGKVLISKDQKMFILI